MAFNIRDSYVAWKIRLAYRTQQERRYIKKGDRAGVEKWSKLKHEAEAMVARREKQLGRVPGARPGDPVIGTDPSSNGPPHGISETHETSGLPNYPAKDWFAPAFSPAVAPVAGVIRRFSGHDPAEGPPGGPHGPLGWSIYLAGDDGNDYFLTHMNSRNVSVGDRVVQGEQIGTVANYDKYGTPSHIHQGIHQGAV